MLSVLIIENKNRCSCGIIVQSFEYTWVWGMVYNRLRDYMCFVASWILRTALFPIFACYNFDFHRFKKSRTHKDILTSRLKVGYGEKAYVCYNSPSMLSDFVSTRTQTEKKVYLFGLQTVGIDWVLFCTKTALPRNLDFCRIYFDVISWCCLPRREVDDYYMNFVAFTSWTRHQLPRWHLRHWYISGIGIIYDAVRISVIWWSHSYSLNFMLMWTRKVIHIWYHCFCTEKTKTFLLYQPHQESWNKIFAPSKRKFVQDLSQESCQQHDFSLELIPKVGIFHAM